MARKADARLHFSNGLGQLKFGEKRLCFKEIAALYWGASDYSVKN